MSAARFWSKVDRGEGCWEWTAHVTAKGYGRLSVGGQRVMAHRYSYELAKGPVANGLFVCHTCDNPPRVNPAHLFLGTKADNNADMVAKGRQVKGEANGRARLTADIVRHIRATHGVEKSAAELAAEFGITPQHVRDIVSFKRWKP